MEENLQSRVRGLWEVQHDQGDQEEAQSDALQHAKISQPREVPCRERPCCRATLYQ